MKTQLTDDGSACYSCILLVLDLVDRLKDDEASRTTRSQFQLKIESY
jgi:hypothetical protein